MKQRSLALLLGLVMLFALAACGTSRPSAQSVAEDAIKALQKADLNAMQETWDETMIEEDVFEDEQAQILLNALTKNLTYKVLSAEENESDGTAVVSMEFTNVDMAPAIEDAFQEIFQKALSSAFQGGQEPTEEEMIKTLVQAITDAANQENAKMITLSAEVPLELVEDQWQIQPDDAILDAMFGGILTAMEAMGEALTE
ncbi:MAG: hypothetical protein Q4G01_08775 [Eubacteriales bacterium]|nr:hypothetical protein [Eubacteriales bacterium]